MGDNFLPAYLIFWGEEGELNFFYLLCLLPSQIIVADARSYVSSRTLRNRDRRDVDPGFKIRSFQIMRLRSEGYDTRVLRRFPRIVEISHCIIAKPRPVYFVLRLTQAAHSFTATNLKFKLNLKNHEESK